MGINPTLQSQTTYEEIIPKSFAPPWLSGPYGTLWHRGIGQYFDIEWQLMHDAALVGFPERTPSDALPFLGSERMLERIPASPNLPGETEAEYRIRLKNVWGEWGAPLPPGSSPLAADAKQEVQRYSLPMGIWEAAGTAAIHMPAVFTSPISGIDSIIPSTMKGWPAWLGLTNTAVYRQHEWAFPPYLVSDRFFAWEHKWSTFWVIIRQPHPFNLLLWGAPLLIWGTSGDPFGPTWGTSAVVSEVERIKRLVVTFKSGHSSCAGIVLFFGAGLFWGDGTWGIGFWGGLGTTSVVWPVGEPNWYQ